VTALALSVVICTRQRAADVARAIESIIVEQEAREGLEVLVVDNGSTDETAATVERYMAEHPVRYVYEERVGLCHARNRGWREAGAPIIAFLDDDATVDPGWVAAIRCAFAEAAAEVGCVGGRILPGWEAPIPHWLSYDASLALGIVDWHPESHRITDLNSEWLGGGNFAVRREALEAVGGFHPWLDRQGTRMLSSGDVFLEKQLMQRGYACVYEPAMCVHHRVSASRLTRSWFRRRYFWQGVSDALMDVIERSLSRRERARVAVARGRQLLSRPRQLVTLFRDTDDPQRFEEQCWTWIALGHVAGLLGVAGR
jgi:glycosyltransferase involved in cell wall biosynthesis